MLPACTQALVPMYALKAVDGSKWFTCPCTPEAEAALKTGKMPKVKKPPQRQRKTHVVVYDSNWVIEPRLYIAAVYSVDKVQGKPSCEFHMLCYCFFDLRVTDVLFYSRVQFTKSH